MLTAELAVLVKLDTIRIVLLVLCCIVVALLAFAAYQCYFYSHLMHLPVNIRIFYLPQDGLMLAQPTNGHNNKTSSEVVLFYHKRYSLVKYFEKIIVNN